MKARHSIFPRGGGGLGTGQRGRMEKVLMWKNFMTMVGWLACIAMPVAPPVVFFVIMNCYRVDLWLIVVVGIIVLVIIGHALMVKFWTSLQEHKVKEVAPVRTVMALGESEIVALQKFLSKTFGGDLQLETDYRFPNGFRSDLVAVHGRGRYPIMCFEVVNSDDEQRIRNAVQELRYVLKPFVNLTRCFILKKLPGGAFQLLKVRGMSTQAVGSFAPELREEIEDSAERSVGQAKKMRLIYPILFLLLVVTPIIESIAILAHVKFSIPGAVSTLLVFWIGAFLGVFGVGIKGYEPKVSDLMAV